MRNLNRGLTPFAGGTDLMVRRMRWSGIAAIDPLFIGHLRELGQVCARGKVLTIGAACTLARLLEEPLIPAVFKEIIGSIAAPAVRNRATIGGNICNASPAADTLPWLYAMEAEVCLQSMAGTRTLPVADFITGPGRHRCRPDELLISVAVPLRFFPGTFYRKVAARRANALSKLSFVGLFQAVDGILEDIRMAFGAVGPTVVRSRDLEDRCRGKNAAELQSFIPELVDLYDRQISPIDDQRSTRGYRRTTALNLLRHFLDEVAGELSDSQAGAGSLLRENDENSREALAGGENGK